MNPIETYNRQNSNRKIIKEQFKFGATLFIIFTLVSGVLYVYNFLFPSADKSSMYYHSDVVKEALFETSQENIDSLSSNKLVFMFDNSTNEDFMRGSYSFSDIESKSTFLVNWTSDAEENIIIENLQRLY